ncbi:MAG: zinc-ribbon domain-containing protein [Candidatus Solibacter usitatus]|nr:zinc-ribbon domain-containing protein [Candidatus Solibacter usitatus]
MPFCTHCGASIGDRHQFCAGCGARQSGAANPKSPGEVWNSFDSRTASLLCYIPTIGWIPAIIVLATDRFRHDVQTRFHAFQGLYLFIAWLMVDWVVRPLTRMGGYGGYFPISSMLKATLLAACIWMIVKVAQRQTYKLPFFGDLAEKSAAEQL